MTGWDGIFSLISHWYLHFNHELDRNLISIGKSKHIQICENCVTMCDVRVLRSFWTDYYDIKEKNYRSKNKAQDIDVLDHYNRLYAPISMETFKRHSGRLGLQLITSKSTNKKFYYNASLKNLQNTSTSTLKRKHSAIDQSPDKCSPKITITMLNIQGLITTNRNKCRFLYDLIKDNNSIHIIGITETWLT